MWTSNRPYLTLPSPHLCENDGKSCSKNITISDDDSDD